MNIQAKTSAHVKTRSIIAGTLLTTDLTRCRKMLEGVLGMECVEPSKGLMYVRDNGHGKGGAKQYAYGLEVGDILVDNVYVTLGYNWRGFSDVDLSASDYTNRGWVLGMRYKFDEDLFRKNDSSVNKTLNPNVAPAKP